MNAPNRELEVRQIWALHPPLTDNGEPFTGFPDDDVRRIYLLAVLLPELQKIDSDWGYLIKNGSHIPSDIIVWHPTMEHFDILTDMGPTWIPDGIITNPDWTFGTLDSEPIPIPIPPIEDPRTIVDVFNKLNEISDRQVETQKAVADIMGKLEHYDREFVKIQPMLLAIAAKLGGGLDVGDILGGFFKK